MRQTFRLFALALFVLIARAMPRRFWSAMVLAAVPTLAEAAGETTLYAQPVPTVGFGLASMVFGLPGADYDCLWLSGGVRQVIAGRAWILEASYAAGQDAHDGHDFDDGMLGGMGPTTLRRPFSVVSTSFGPLFTVRQWESGSARYSVSLAPKLLYAHGWQGRYLRTDYGETTVSSPNATPVTYVWKHVELRAVESDQLSVGIDVVIELRVLRGYLALIFGLSAGVATNLSETGRFATRNTYPAGPLALPWGNVADPPGPLEQPSVGFVADVNFNLLRVGYSF